MAYGRSFRRIEKEGKAKFAIAQVAMMLCKSRQMIRFFLQLTGEDGAHGAARARYLGIGLLSS